MIATNPPPTTSRSKLDLRPTRRVLLAAAALAFVMVSISAIWLALSTRAATDNAAQAARYNRALESTRFSLSRLNVLERGLELSAQPRDAAQLLPLVTTLDRNLAAVARRGGPVDRRQFSALRQTIPTLREQLSALSTAVLTDADYRQARHVQRSLTRIQGRINRATDAAVERHGGAVRAGFEAASASQTAVFAETLIAAVLGALLIIAGWGVIRYKSRLDAAQELELERLRGAALTDSLTQLPNHRAFHDHLDGLLGRRPAALVIIDLNGLKRVNDTEGHQAGDEAIKALADGLRRTVQGDRVACRIGGDEFAVILPGGSAMEGFFMAQELRDALRAPVNGFPAVHATAGVADTADVLDKDILIHRADVALLEAKRAHRGVLVYSVDLEQKLAPVPRSTRHHVNTLATSLARAVDAKDAYTHSHCETVAELCALIATELGLPSGRVAQVRLAGLLHDVGKIGISDAILQKPGPLNAEEFEVMCTHTTQGWHIVSAAELYDEAGWILHHHERMDGTGYPDRLEGERIPLESRIIMVADAFEALTADRPYRHRSSVAEALAELERNAGTQFDPRCLVALKAVVAGDHVVGDELRSRVAA